MKTSEDGNVIEFEKGEEIVLDREYEWIDASDFANRSLGRSIMIRGLKSSKSDLEKFIELYNALTNAYPQVIVSREEKHKERGYQYVNVPSKRYNFDIKGFDSFAWVRFYFDESGKFIQQGIWE
jgi:hypothetical protein